METEPGPASSMSWHTNVKHVPDQDTPRVPLTGDNFLYVFKPGP
jgi:hypothetical protein